MLIIGSKALGERKPKDLDMIATKEEMNQWIELQGDKISKIKEHKVHFSMYHSDGYWVEIEIAKPNNTCFEYQKIMESLGEIKDIPLASKEILFSIKKSHINFPIKFDKHIQDYILLRKWVGEDKYPELTKLRFKETEERIGRKLVTPKLSTSNDDFFDKTGNFVKYHFVHDELHELMSHRDRPIYTYMQKDTSSAWCVQSMWDDLDHQWKIEAVLEEAYVIALERKMIPMLLDRGNFYTTESAFKWSLMRICTTLCGGWFRQWATDHYDEILGQYNDNYFDKFTTAFMQGKLKRNYYGD